MSAELKDLLTFAAKACGYENLGYTENGLKVPNPELECGFDYWAPHLDDGDGARMEEKLGIEFEWHTVGVASSIYSDDAHGKRWLGANIREREAYADHNNDRQAARRWASLRAAAQIGKGMT